MKRLLLPLLTIGAACHLGACATPKPVVAPEQVADAQQRFDAWLETDFAQPASPSMRGAVDLSFVAGVQRGSTEEYMDVPGSFRGDFAVLDVSHWQMTAEYRYDPTALELAEFPTAVDVGLHFVADGQRMWLLPELRQDFLIAAMEEAGFAKSVVSLKLSTLARAADRLGALASLNELGGLQSPAELLRWIPSSPVRVSAFYERESQVEIVLIGTEEFYASLGEGADEASIEYRIFADAQSGWPTQIEARSRTPRFDLDLRIDLEQVAPASMPEELFTFQIPEGWEHKPFDAILDIGVNAVVAEEQPADDDLDL